jgi:hypothetical protein
MSYSVNAITSVISGFILVIDFSPVFESYCPASPNIWVILYYIWISWIVGCWLCVFFFLEYWKDFERMNIYKWEDEINRFIWQKYYSGTDERWKAGIIMTSCYWEFWHLMKTEVGVERSNRIERYLWDRLMSLVLWSVS